MVTMTTVGYGDMPTLRHEVRILTMFVGFIGVAVVGGSVTVIADWFSQVIIHQSPVITHHSSLNHSPLITHLFSLVPIELGLGLGLG